MKVLVYKDIPEKLKEQPSHSDLLNSLMEKMELHEIAVIKKKDWKAKVKPARMYQSVNYYNKYEFCFSQREDEKNYYLMKVLFPIDVMDKHGNYKRRNDWVKGKTKWRITYEK